MLDRGNIWNQQYHSDDSDIVRRGTQPFSLTGIQGVRLGNADVFYLVSASAGGAITVNLPSATKNTGAVHFIKLRSTGDVIAASAGGTLRGSATMSDSGAFQAWRSNGVDWWPEFQPGLTDPLNVNVLNAGSLSVSGNAVITGDMAVSGTFSAEVIVAGSASSNHIIVGDLFLFGDLQIGGSVTISGTAHFLSQPVFPDGFTTSITGGAMVVYAGNRLYEISLGASDIALVLPDPAAASGMRATVKIKATTGGQVLLSGHIEGSATVSATVTISAALTAANFIAGQSTWWRA